MVSLHGLHPFFLIRHTEIKFTKDLKKEEVLNSTFLCYITVNYDKVFMLHNFVNYDELFMSHNFVDYDEIFMLHT